MPMPADTAASVAGHFAGCLRIRQRPCRQTGRRNDARLRAEPETASNTRGHTQTIFREKSPVWKRAAVRPHPWQAVAQFPLAAMPWKVQRRRQRNHSSALHFLYALQKISLNPPNRTSAAGRAAAPAP